VGLGRVKEEGERSEYGYENRAMKPVKIVLRIWGEMERR
jgi:hypothetical protein